MSLDRELLEWLTRPHHEPVSGWARDLPYEELHTHPDLVQRVTELAKPIRGTCRVWVHGYPVIHHPNGTPIAFAAGTHVFAARTDRLAAALAPREPFDTGLDPSWVQLDPFTVDVALARGIDLLRAHVARAFALAEERAWA